MRSSNEISLYIHLPFCTHKCPYCHFYVVQDKDTLKESLLDGLEIEWQRWKGIFQDKKLTSIYFGGGTPILFEPKRIEKLLSWLPFCDTSEITIEANPENITFEQMQKYADLGINRVSIGVQSFDQNELDTLDRRHAPERAIKAVENCYQAGIHNISIDLMYELPHQTLSSWKRSLEIAAHLPISHLSLYNLTIEPDTPFKRNEEALKKLLPSQEIGTEMYLTAIQTLEKAGFLHYEISAFCRDGMSSKHNVGYWTAREFIGLGPSAFSFFENKRFQNIANLVRYTKLLQNGESSIDFEDAVSHVARKREFLALGLRLLKGVTLSEFEYRFGSLCTETKETLKNLEQQNLLIQQENRLALTSKGILFYDTVASEII